MTAEPRCWGGGGGVSHPSQLTTGLVIKSVTTSPTLAGERMLFILQVSILSEQTIVYCIICYYTYPSYSVFNSTLSKRDFFGGGGDLKLAKLVTVIGISLAE